MLPDVISSLLSFGHLNSSIKIVVLLLLGGYLVFLIIIARQVHLMNQIFTQNVYGSLLQFLAILLILATIVLSVVSIAIL